MVRNVPGLLRQGDVLELRRGLHVVLPNKAHSDDVPPLEEGLGAGQAVLAAALQVAVLFLRPQD